MILSHRHPSLSFLHEDCLEILSKNLFFHTPFVNLLLSANRNRVPSEADADRTDSRAGQTRQRPPRPPHPPPRDGVTRQRHATALTDHLRGNAEDEKHQDLHPHGRGPGTVNVLEVTGANESQDSSGSK